MTSELLFVNDGKSTQDDHQAVTKNGQLLTSHMSSKCHNTRQGKIT